MQVSAHILETIDGAVSDQKTRLGAALHDLAVTSRGRGTCLLLDHSDFGEALIADQNWPLGLDETQRDRDRLAVVDLREGHGFLRIAVLAVPSSTGALLPIESCELATAALRAVEAVTEIATEFMADIRPSSPDMGASPEPRAVAYG